MTDRWDGDAILARYLDAAREAVDETTAAAVPIARGLVRVDTGLLRSRIGTVPARTEGTRVVGAFGVPDDPGYALPQEYLPEPRGRAYMRPAADLAFPTLAGRIRARVRP